MVSPEFSDITDHLSVAVNQSTRIIVFFVVFCSFCVPFLLVLRFIV